MKQSCGRSVPVPILQCLQAVGHAVVRLGWAKLFRCSRELGRERGRCRPSVESLGERCLPAVFHVTSQTSLERAILAANRNAQADAIVLRNDITLKGDALPAFTRDAGRPVVLSGNGFTLQRAGAAQFRILHNKGARLTVEGLTVTGGVASVDGGGGLFNESGRLTLRRVKVAGNMAVGDTVGGGVYNAPGARLTILHSKIVDNQSATFGGGVRNQGLVRLIRDSLFANNVALTHGGGGLCNYFGGQVDLVLNSTFMGNSAVNGGGICNHGTVSLDGCTIVYNAAKITGGGIENDNVVPLLSNSVVAGNQNGQIFPNPPLVSENNFISDGPPPSDPR